MSKRKQMIEQIDRMRAGLLDDDPDVRRHLQQLVTDHPELADEVTRWEEFVGELDSAAEGELRIENQLRLRRREVLSGRYKKPVRWAPQFAVAATLALAVGIGLFLAADDNEPTDLANLDVEMLELPDLANNIDFYTWMETRAVE